MDTASDRRYGRKDCTTIILDINRSGEKENCSLYTKHYGTRPGKNGNGANGVWQTFCTLGKFGSLNHNKLKGKGLDVLYNSGSTLMQKCL